ncbi:PEP/pyruvate-binding domain-containing protein [Kribbella sp. NPDC056861]|uniref:PEP/pyruvate-binding domain-containing protein n=1 Tax=Kribbella sp. NPDC056861 TaxID=3154857 RepID=UPI003443325C
MIIPLTEATPQNAGAKAAVLGQLTQAGFAVPPGFVIPVAAYRAATAHLDLTNPHDAHRLVESQPVPPRLLDELADALAELGNHPVAVRSSATTEDTPTASAAGQHDSYLGIEGLPAIAAKIQAIWASLWSPRAISYRQRAAALTPATAAPAPATATAAPAPATAAPAPATIAPAPGATTPAPATIAPAPGATTPAPATIAPAPGATTPAPATIAPAPGATTPAPAAAAPATAALASGTTPVAHSATALAPAAAAAAPAIAILIQRHIDADVAGVLFTADPRTTNTAVLESSWGLGESVVQGLVTPDTYTLSPDGTLTRHLGPKQTRRDRNNATIITTEVPAPQQHQPTLTDNQARQIIRLGQQVATHLGTPQDIEFALSGQHIWLLQSRPITAPLDAVLPPRPITAPLAAVASPRRVESTTRPDPGSPNSGAPLRRVEPDLLGDLQDQPPATRPDSGSPNTGVLPLVEPAARRGDPAIRPDSGSLDSDAPRGRGESDLLGDLQDQPPAMRIDSGSLDSGAPAQPEPGVLRGVGGSPGVATGPARIVNGIEDFNRVKPGDILVCRFTDPAWTPLFNLVAGVITEVGGRLSHAAIVAREHRIPAVLGVPNALKTLTDNHPTRIDGTTGQIAVAPTSNPL